MDTQILVSVGASVVVAAVLVLLVLAWRVGSAWLAAQKNNDLAFWLSALVSQAEMTMQGAEGVKKLEWVLNEAQRLYPGIDPAIVRPLVEQAVLMLNARLKR